MPKNSHEIDVNAHWSQKMGDRPPGWYAGYWGDQFGIRGGSIFHPIHFLQNSIEKPESKSRFTPTIQFWTGTELLEERPKN